MADPDIDTLISQATKDISDEEGRKVTAEKLTAVLRAQDRPASPDFPNEWRSEPKMFEPGVPTPDPFDWGSPELQWPDFPNEWRPEPKRFEPGPFYWDLKKSFRSQRSEQNVMFEPGDPEPEPLDWGPPKWPTEQAYDEDLAKFLGDLACGRDVSEAQTRGLARRALVTAGFDKSIKGEPDRVWLWLFAARLIGPDCPPAKGLPEDMRHQLEQLAAKADGEPAAQVTVLGPS
jgi:hypothetical protein